MPNGGTPGKRPRGFGRVVDAVDVEFEGQFPDSGIGAPFSSTRGPCASMGITMGPLFRDDDAIGGKPGLPTDGGGSRSRF